WSGYEPRAPRVVADSLRTARYPDPVPPGIPGRRGSIDQAAPTPAAGPRRGGRVRPGACGGKAPEESLPSEVGHAASERHDAAGHGRGRGGARRAVGGRVAPRSRGAADG